MDASLNLPKRKEVQLRLTYVATSVVFLAASIVLFKLIYCNVVFVLKFKPLCKLFLFSLIASETLSLLDDWFFDKKVGLRIANFLHLWPKKDNTSPQIELVKNRIWEGHIVLEIFLFVILSAITLLTW